MIRLHNDLELVREALAIADRETISAASRFAKVDRATISKWLRHRERQGPQWPTDQDIAEHRKYRAESAELREQRRQIAARYRRRRYLNGNRPLSASSLGTIRRIQALCALGYTYGDIAEALGVTQQRIGHLLNQKVVLPEMRQKVAAVYEELCMTIPQDPEVLQERECPVHKRARNRARQRGWAPPLAWDNIDDPHERPKGMPQPGRAPLPKRPPMAELKVVRVSAMEDILERGGNIYDACRELQLSRNALWRWCQNNKLTSLYSRLAGRAREKNNTHQYEGSAA